MANNSYTCPAPFWFWNGALSADELLYQVDEMHAKSVPAFVIHARSGLEVPYLSDRWFDLVAVVLRRAREYGMQVWLYDEENFPSGYGGGKVIEKDPSLYGKHLKIRQCKNNRDVRENTVSVVKEGKSYYAFDACKTLWQPAYTDSIYIDVLRKESAQLFIESVHEQYYARFSEYFGSTIVGFFIDEPGFYNNIHFNPATMDDDTVVWTDDFGEVFFGRCGYDIRDRLYDVFRNAHEDSALVRRDYFETAGEMYRERFLLPIREYCHSRGVLLIGHLHMEDYMHFQIGTQGNFIKALDCLDFAGLDKIDRNDRKITEKVVSSAAHIRGKNIVMSESFACSGWALDFSEMKRIADYQFVRGVNFSVPHAFYYSIEDFRKFEAPPSQFVQNPYWKYYGEFSRYVSSVCSWLQKGIPSSQILVYYPAESAISRYTPDDFAPCIELDKRVQDLALALLDRQLDFDFIDEEGLLGIDTDGIVQGIRRELLIVPYAERIDLSTLRKISELSIPVIFAGSDALASLNPADEPEFAEILSKLRQKDEVTFLPAPALIKAYTYRFDDVALYSAVCRRITPRVRLRDADSGIQYLVREDGDQTVYFFVNADAYPKRCSLTVRENKMPHRVDIASGAKAPIPCEFAGDYVTLDLRFAPHESILIVCRGGRRKVQNPTVKYTVQEITDVKLQVNGCELSGWGYWTDRGKESYSGTGEYTFTFRSEHEGDAYLYLTNVKSTAEVFVNDERVGVGIFSPFKFNLTPHLRGVGKDNAVRIVVTNTLSNQFGDTSAHGGIAAPVYVVYESKS